MPHGLAAKVVLHLSNGPLPMVTSKDLILIELTMRKAMGQPIADSLPAGRIAGISLTTLCLRSKAKRNARLNGDLILDVLSTAINFNSESSADGTLKEP